MSSTNVMERGSVQFKDFGPPVQVHLTCNEELDRFYLGFKDPKVRKQSNLDYSVLKYVFS